MVLTLTEIILCLAVAALIGALGYLYGQAIGYAQGYADNEHQAPEPAELETWSAPQTFDQWRLTGHQPWPAITRGPDPVLPPVPALTLLGLLAVHDTLANLALADRLEREHYPELDAGRHEVTSPDLMALDVEAMITRYRDEIGELVDQADRKMGELTRA